MRAEIEGGRKGKGNQHWENNTQKIQAEALCSHTSLITASPPRCSCCNLLTPTAAAVPDVSQRGEPAGHRVTKAMLIPPCVSPCEAQLKTTVSPASCFPIHYSSTPSTAPSFFLPLRHISIICSKANQSFTSLTICCILHTAKNDQGSP